MKRKNRSKKAQGLSMQTIIIAVLALIVLVILVLVYRGGISKGASNIFNIGDTAASQANRTDLCETLLGSNRCIKSADDCSNGITESGYSDCKDDTPLCCVR